MRRGWKFRREDSDQSRSDLIALGEKLPVRDSLSVYAAHEFQGSWGEFHYKVIEVVELIREENNIQNVVVSVSFLHVEVG